MRRVILTLFLFTISCEPAFAQEQVSVVVAVKQQLEAQGVDLSGPCGAFQITKRVAWRLRNEGAGLLAKPAGNNCDGYSVDFITYPDGAGVDILGDSGTANRPNWDPSEPPGALVGRWRAPFDPDPVIGIPVPIPAPPVVFTPPPVDLQALILAELRAHEAAEAEFREQVRSVWRTRLVFLSKYVLPAVGAIFAGRASK